MLRIQNNPNLNVCLDYAADIFINICAQLINENITKILVLLWSSPELQFKLNFWSSSPWFSPWFACQPELDWKIVLGSGYSHMVRFWFGLPELNFDFNYNDVGVNVDVKVLSSRFALLVNWATFSLFEDIYLF
ncbi:hypothetical protein BDR05DRAFT_945409 [Suillus weaverae]|nr:hypothetical protein BDR05DRAFT_945409 [Suillus weaverae]